MSEQQHEVGSDVDAYVRELREKAKEFGKKRELAAEHGIEVFDQDSEEDAEDRS